MLSENEIPDTLIDPDPFTVAGVFISAAALILQFIQVYRDAPNKVKSIDVRPSNHQFTQLQHLEEALEDLERELVQLERVINRGLSDADSQCYDVKFGVSLAAMKFEANWHGEFTSKLVDSYGKLSAIAMWVNHTIGQNPSMVEYIGQEMMSSMESSADRLNKIIRDGENNRAIITEGRNVIYSCKMAITRLLDRKN